MTSRASESSETGSGNSDGNTTNKMLSKSASNATEASRQKKSSEEKSQSCEKLQIRKKSKKPDMSTEEYIKLIQYYADCKECSLSETINKVTTTTQIQADSRGGNPTHEQKDKVSTAQADDAYETLNVAKEENEMCKAPQVSIGHKKAILLKWNSQCEAENADEKNQIPEKIEADKMEFGNEKVREPNHNYAIKVCDNTEEIQGSKGEVETIGERNNEEAGRAAESKDDLKVEDLMEKPIKNSGSGRCIGLAKAQVDVPCGSRKRKQSDNKEDDVEVEKKRFRLEERDKSDRLSLPPELVALVLTYCDAISVIRFSQCNHWSKNLVERNINRLPKPQIIVRIFDDFRHSNSYGRLVYCRGMPFQVANRTPLFQVELYPGNRAFRRFNIPTGAYDEIAAPSFFEYRSGYIHPQSGIVMCSSLKDLTKLNSIRNKRVHFDIFSKLIDGRKLIWLCDLIRGMNPDSVSALFIAGSGLYNSYKITVENKGPMTCNYFFTTFLGKFMRMARPAITQFDTLAALGKFTLNFAVGIHQLDISTPILRQFPVLWSGSLRTPKTFHWYFDTRAFVCDQVENDRVYYCFKQHNALPLKNCVKAGSAMAEFIINPRDAPYPVDESNIWSSAAEPEQNNGAQ